MSGFAIFKPILRLLICMTLLTAPGPVHAQSRVIEVTPSGTEQPAQIDNAPANLAAQPAQAQPSANVGNPISSGPEQRLALVIGNSAYEHVNPLTNPLNDAKEVAKLLSAAGFEVLQGIDLDHDEMIKIIQDFASSISKRGPDTVAFVYYAGHGVQIAGDNFLVPVDASITDLASVDGATVRLVDLMATLEAVPSRMRIVVLDACRNNPFQALQEAGKGLAIVDAPNGSIVGYSTAPGSEARDGTGKNSPYAAAFIHLARQPNVPIEQFFKRVRVLVNDATDGNQTPWESSSLTSDFFFFGDTAVAAKEEPPKSTNTVQQLASRTPQEAYDIALQEDSIDYYQEFVRLYPSDPLCNHVRTLLAGRVESVAWHNATLDNSADAYRDFYNRYSNTQYAQAALKLQNAPKPQPLYQPTHIIVPPQLVPNVRFTTLQFQQQFDQGRQRQQGQFNQGERQGQSVSNQNGPVVFGAQGKNLGQQGQSQNQQGQQQGQNNKSGVNLGQLNQQQGQQQTQQQGQNSRTGDVFIKPGTNLNQQGQLQNQQQSQLQNQQQGQQPNQGGLSRNDQVFNRPGRNLLQLNQDSNGPVSVLSDNRFRSNASTGFGQGNTGFAAQNVNKPVGTDELDSRIVRLSNGGSIKIGQGGQNTNLPANKVETFNPRQFSSNQVSQSQNNFQNRFDQRANGLSSRADLGTRINNNSGSGGGGNFNRGNFGSGNSGGGNFNRQNFNR